MEYSRFDDVAALLIDLCKPFSDEELIRLGNVCHDMAHNKHFGDEYLAAVKGLYVKNFQKIKTNSYKKRSYMEIDGELTEKINNHSVGATLFPSYLKDDRELSNKKIANMRCRIEKLKTNS